MTQEERRSHIEEIRSVPELMEQTVAGLDDDQLDTPYRDGGWTIRQVVHHVIDSHLNAFTRMKMILTEDHPTLKPYDQDAWALLSDSALPLEPTLDIARGLHYRWTALLESIPEESWNRTAYHPENGEVTLEGLLKNYSDHGKHHAGQITELRNRKGW